MVKKIIFYIIILSIVTSCNYRRSGPHKDFQAELAGASPDFSQGWKDGCEVGQAAGSDIYYKMFLKNNKVDGWKMANSSDYKTAWNFAFWYCYRNDYIDQKSPPFRSFFSGMQ